MSRTPRTSTTLDAEELINLSNGFLFAEQIHQPLNCCITIRCEDLANFEPSKLTAWMTKTLKAMSTWLRRRDVAPCYVFVAEYGGAYKPDSDTNTGVHVHGLIHCPVALLPAFMAFMTSIVGGGPRTTFFSRTNHPIPGDPCQHIRTERQRGFKLLYLLKGASDKALKMLTPPEWKTYTGGMQGTIIGKRSWISHSIGKEAQQRAGYKRLTKLHQIKEALAPILSETKKAGRLPRPSSFYFTPNSVSTISLAPSASSFSLTASYTASTMTVASAIGASTLREISV